MKLLGAAGIFLVAGVMSAHAASPVAQLSELNGKVLMNAGHGYVTANAGDMTVGSKIFVGQDSSAKLTYSNGCVVGLTPGSVVTVAAKAPCGTNQAAEAVQTTGNSSALVNAAADLPPAPEGFPPALAILGLGAAVGIGVVIISTDDNSSSP